jgi:phosphocarrier protein
MVIACIFTGKHIRNTEVSMVSKQMVITNELGMHARPASLLIHTAKKYKSACTISKNGQSAAFNSLAALMKLRIKNGDTVTLNAEGPDENNALENIAALIENNFGEKADGQNAI